MAVLVTNQVISVSLLLPLALSSSWGDCIAAHPAAEQSPDAMPESHEPSQSATAGLCACATPEPALMPP